MGKIKKILENELIGGTEATDVYPITSIKAVYNENNERLDNILGDLDDKIVGTQKELQEELNHAVESITPIEITGNVTNAPDEEDLTSINVEGTDVLKFKDKVYNPLAYSGLGRKILRKNIVNGVNTLTQNMINKSDTIYIIQYDFILGEDITIPTNCILKFDGGSFSGAYTIIGQNTSIEAGLVKIFSTDTTFDGSWNVAESYPEWFGAKGDGTTDDTNAIQKCINSFDSKIVLTKAYGVSSIYLEDTSVKLFGVESAKLIGIQANTSIIHISGVSKDLHIANFRIETKEENVIGIYSDGLPHIWGTAGMWESKIENIYFYNCYSAIKLRAIDNENQQTYDTANQFFVINNIIIYNATVDLDIIGQVGQNSFNNCYFQASKNRIRFIRINTTSSSTSDGTYLYINNCSFVFDNPDIDALFEFIVKQGSMVFFNGCWFENIKCALLKDPINVYCVISKSVFLNCPLPYVVLGRASGTTIIIEETNMGFTSLRSRDNYDDGGLTYIDKTNNTQEEELYSTFIYHRVINEITLANSKVLKIQSRGVTDSYNTIGKHANNTYNIVEIEDPNSNHLAYISLNQIIHIHRHYNTYSIFTNKPLIGTTTDRTDIIDTSKIYKGFQYFDTTLGKQIYWNGSAWVDSTGANV